MKRLKTVGSGSRGDSGIARTKQKPKRILIAAEVNREHNYHVYGKHAADVTIFNFKPGQRWTFANTYPGNPVEMEIHKSLFNELQAERILKGVFKNG